MNDNLESEFKSVRMYKKFGKRIIDLIISLLALPFVVVVVIVCSPIIYITDRGPIFYNAERLGLNGSTYKMYKLRSMKVNSPDLRNEDGSTFNGDDDPRVTKIGRIMRKTSIDELPQFFNVLKGEMSIIGPRPFVTTHYYGYENLSDNMKKRLSVRPGVTGYSQAYFRNSITQNDKILNDIYYAENIS
ncbi:MAG: sugar transferase, partial [Parasporobacterium sp.]|nr:sugar transferase [Parasporobacterium sp.]